jgi:hypothetical protein
MFHEGQAVTSIGDGRNTGVALGTHGKILLLASDTAGHIQWSDGPLAGQVTLVPRLADEVAPLRGHAASREPSALDDSLEYGVIHTGARHVLATGGMSGLFQALATSGAFAEMGEVAEEARSYVESRLRRSATLGVHLSELDPDDQDEVYRVASLRLLAENIRSVDG